jgi:hypothetical protein
MKQREESEELREEKIRVLKDALLFLLDDSPSPAAPPEELLWEALADVMTLQQHPNDNGTNLQEHEQGETSQ